MTLDIFAAKRAFAGSVNLLEAQAVADLQKAYAAAWDRLDAGYQQLANRVKADVAAGNPPRAGDLYRMDRFVALMNDAEGAYKTLARQATAIGDSTVNAAMDAAARDYRGLIGAVQGAGGVVPAGDWTVSLNRDAMLAAMGYTSARSPLTKLLSQWGDAAFQQTRKALVSGIVAGKGTNVIASDLRRILGTNLWRSQLIARTEAHRVYREVGRMTAEQNPDAFDGWMWRAACDSNTCAICWSMHGQVFPAKVPMDTHPGCRCALVPNPRSFASILGEPIPDVTQPFRTNGADLFKRLPPAQQRRVLGPARYGLYREGFPLSSFIEAGPKSKWGRTPRLVPLRYMPERVSALNVPALEGAASLGAAIAPGYPDWVNNAAKKRRVDRYIAQHPGLTPRMVPRWVGQAGMVPGTRPARLPRRVAGAPPAVPLARPVARAPLPPAPPPIKPVPNPPNAFPALPRQSVVNPLKPAEHIQLPPVPQGARPMFADEVLRQARRMNAGQGDLIWKPRPGGVPGAGHWGRNPVESPTRAQRLSRMFPGEPAKSVPNPLHPGELMLLPEVPKGARPMNQQELLRFAKRRDMALPDNQRLVWKPSPGGKPGEGHWGRPLGAPVTGPAWHPAAPAAPAAPAPAPAPNMAVKRGGAPPPNWMTGPKLRRWLRWQAENPNAPIWQKPPNAYLANKALPNTIARLPIRVRQLAAQTPVFPRGGGPTGARQADRWGVAPRQPHRVPPSASALARLADPAHPPMPLPAQRPPGWRPMTAQELARHKALLAKGDPGLVWKVDHWGAPPVRAPFAAQPRAYQPAAPPKPPTVLEPLPVPKPVLPPLSQAEIAANRASRTGTHKGSPPEEPVLQPSLPPGTTSYPPSKADYDALMRSPIESGHFAGKSAGGVSESYRVTLRDPVTGAEVKALVKPNSGNSPTAAGRTGIAGRTETEREYGAYVINRHLGGAVDHQVSVIRDMGTFYDPVTGKTVALGRSVVNLWHEPTPPWEVSYGSFNDIPKSEQVAASLFDALIYNVDRHGNNYVVYHNKATNEYHLFCWDPSLSLLHIKSGTDTASTAAGSMQFTSSSRPLDAASKERLRTFLQNETVIRQELEALIGRVATDGVFMRARWMWQHGRTLSSRELASLVWWDQP